MSACPTSSYQLPPPPPPPPPPEKPPEKPLDPDAPGVEAIVPAVVVVNPSIDEAKRANVKGLGLTYHRLVSGSWPSSPAKARAHFSVAWKTMAYGRYSENKLWRSAKRARSFSLSSMKRLKPRVRWSTP